MQQYMHTAQGYSTVQNLQRCNVIIPSEGVEENIKHSQHSTSKLVNSLTTYCCFFERTTVKTHRTRLASHSCIETDV